jgi:ubiquinone/menaquinone biosynthesis C-methylase UbiE
MPFDHFDLIAGLYKRIAGFIIPSHLYKLLELPYNGLLLDAGGGTGRVAEALRIMVHIAIVADLSRGMLRIAVSKGLVTTCTPTEHLPFPSKTFDRIIIKDALHHVIDQHQTIRELWRVLAPGGKIVIIEPDIDKYSVKLIALVEKILLMRSHFLSQAKIVALFEDQGSQIRFIRHESNIWIFADKVK